MSRSSAQSPMRGGSSGSMTGKLVVGPELSRSSPTSSKSESDRGNQRWESPRVQRQASLGSPASMMTDGSVRSFPPMPPRYFDAPSSPYNGIHAPPSPYNGAYAPPSPYNGHQGFIGSVHSGPMTASDNGSGNPHYSTSPGASYNGYGVTSYGNGWRGPIANGNDLAAGSPGTAISPSQHVKAGTSGDLSGFQTEYLTGHAAGEAEYYLNPIWPTTADRAGNGSQWQSSAERAEASDWRHARALSRNEPESQRNQAHLAAGSGSGRLTGGYVGPPSAGSGHTRDSAGRQTSPPESEYLRPESASWQAPAVGHGSISGQLSDAVDQTEGAQMLLLQSIEDSGSSGEQGWMAHGQSEPHPSVLAQASELEHARGDRQYLEGEGTGMGTNTVRHSAENGFGNVNGNGGISSSTSSAGVGVAAKPTAGWTSGAGDEADGHLSSTEKGSTVRADNSVNVVRPNGGPPFPKSESAEKLEGAGFPRNLKEKSLSDPSLLIQCLPPPKAKSPVHDQAIGASNQVSPPSPSKVGTTVFSRPSPTSRRPQQLHKPDNLDRASIGVSTRGEGLQRNDPSVQSDLTPGRLHSTGTAGEALPAGSASLLRTTRSVSPSPRSQGHLSPASASHPAYGSAGNGTPNSATDKDGLFDSSPSSLDVGGPLPRRSQSDIQVLKSSVQSLQATMQGVVSAVQQLVQMQQLQVQIVQAPNGGGNNLHEAINKLGSSFQASIDELTALIKHKDEQQQARLFNLASTYDDDPMMPLPNDKGKLPGNFPATRRHFVDMTTESIVELAHLYGIPLEPEDDRLDRLGRFCGLRIC